MARSARSIHSRIYGIPNSYRTYPYKDLSEVLNKVGVMAKRNKIPYFIFSSPLAKRKDYIYDSIEYYVPVNWRECLYEDLETGDYYIISPDPNNDSYVYSWIVFKITSLRADIRRTYRDNDGKLVREIAHHSGTLIDLLSTRGADEVFDTLAKNQKPIIVKLQQWVERYNSIVGSICRFDI